MQAKALDFFGAVLVFALCVIWGFNQVVAKLALPDVGPIAQIGSATLGSSWPGLTRPSRLRPFRERSGNKWLE